MQLHKVGDRVQIHPATDAWISGDRYGTIVKIGRKWIYVKMDRSGKVRKLTADLIYENYGQEVTP